MARDPRTKDCAIKGCTRAERTGQLCGQHYGMVPWQLRQACAVEVMSTSHSIAKKHHRRQLAFVRKQLRALGEGQ